MEKNEQKVTLFIPSDEYGEELEKFAKENGYEFDPEPESNITAEIMCSLAFGLVAATAAVGQLLLQYKSLKNERITLVTANGIYRNITLEQAKIIIQEEQKSNGIV